MTPLRKYCFGLAIFQAFWSVLSVFSDHDYVNIQWAVFFAAWLIVEGIRMAVEQVRPT